jgi:hypothetical protein
MEPPFVQVIVTSWLYPDGNFDIVRLRRLSGLVGKERLVLDLRYYSHYTAPGVQAGPGPICLYVGFFIIIIIIITIFMGFGEYRLVLDPR